MSAVMEIEAPTIEAPPRERCGDEPLYEVVNGERVELPDMSIYAQAIAMRLCLAFSAYLEQTRIGVAVHETLLVLDPEINLKRRPDAAVIGSDRWPSDRELPEEGDIEVVPTLAVEVVSPNDLMHEVLHKVHEYLRYGVTEVWMIVPEEQVLYRYRSPTDVEIIPQAGVLTGDPLLPGFRLAMSELLQRKLATTPSITAGAPDDH